MSERASAAVSKATGAPDPLIGRLINDRFKITALIARGGMGKVYRAEQAPLGRLCAIKVLNPNYAGEHDPEFHKRFFLEASIASKLTHPNTVTIFDYGRTDDDIYYMSMEYLDGQTLHRAIREAGFFPEERAAHVARQICRALREAHSLGVIHRDLKPANIFLVEHGDETDFVKVLDFGLVKNVSDTKGEDLTQTGLFMGSPKYMAPEQIRGDRVDARTDVYALGIILYEMLTGKVPFDRPNSVNILMAHVNEDAPPMRQMNPNINISQALEETVARCMAKDVDQRFRSMDEVLAALKRIGGGAMTATISGVGATGEYRAMSSSDGHSTLPMNGTGSGSHNAAFLSPSSSEPGLLAAPLGTSGTSDSSAAVVAPATKSGSKGVLIASVAAGIAAVAVVAFLALRPGDPPAPKGAGANGATNTAQTSTSTPTSKDTAAVGPEKTAAATGTVVAPSTGAAAPTTSEAAPVPGARHAIMKIRTVPNGVTVKDNGVEICNETPCDHAFDGDDADPEKEHKLTFSKSGFRDEAKSVKLGDSPVRIELKAAPRVFTGGGNPAPPQGGKTEQPPPVPGFKDFP